MTTQTVHMFIVHVSDAAASAEFYGKLLDLAPVLEHPRYVAFALPGGAHFAVWSGSDASGDLTPEPTTPRTSELCLCLGTTAEIDERFADWRDRGIRIVAEPYDDVFGRTFLAADPDGNLLRIAPVD